MTVFQDGMLSGGRIGRHTGPGKGRGGTKRGSPAAWTLSSAEEQLETSGGAGPTPAVSIRGRTSACASESMRGEGLAVIHAGIAWGVEG